ncbi:MAG: aminotransferase class III-fold pyridoxal phosphate-dependent enzyme [Amphritea sp.]
MKTNRRDFMKLTGALPLVKMAGLAGIGTMATTIPARVAAAAGGSIMTPTALKYSPNATVEDSYPTNLPGVIPREEVMKLAEQELATWLANQPKSKAMTERAKQSSPFGVLGNHQKDWNNMPQNIYCDHAYGNKYWDLDGNEYLDFCLGDTPDMYGHGGLNPAIKAAAASMLENGIHTMSGNEDGVVCCELMAQKFGLSHWMANLSASDSNRAILAIARQVTGRNIIAIPNFTYHGNIDETQKIMPEVGVVTRVHEMNVYQHADVGDRTRIFNYNDLDSLEAVLKDGQVACVMMEPIMSNFGWAWPKDDWNKKAYALCQKYGTKLSYDETHTLSAGPAGACGELGLHGYYDFWACGKAIASGVPTGVFGMTEEVAHELHRQTEAAGLFGEAAFGQLGTLLSGNTVSAKALRVTLEEVLIDEVYGLVGEHVQDIVDGMNASIKKYNAPFLIETMGNRISYTFIPERCHDPISASVGIGFGGLFEFSHTYAWNRGIMIMPYFNMLIVTPVHTQEDTVKWLPVWDDIVRILMGK